MLPFAVTTIYELEKRGEFPRRFHLSAGCVVWDQAEVEEWLDERRRLSDLKANKRAPVPDVRLRKARPVKSSARGR